MTSIVCFGVVAMTDFPEDVLRLIVEFCDIGDLLVFSRVCTMFKGLYSAMAMKILYMNYRLDYFNFIKKNKKKLDKLCCVNNDCPSKWMITHPVLNRRRRPVQGYAIGSTSFYYSGVPLNSDCTVERFMPYCVKCMLNYVLPEDKEEKHGFNVPIIFDGLGMRLN